MFNIVAKVAGVAALGGAVLLGVYTYHDTRREPVPAGPLATDLAGVEPVPTPTPGFDGPPAELGMIDFEEGQDGERVEDPTALRDPLPVPDPEEPDEEAQRLARLGTGGLVDLLADETQSETVEPLPPEAANGLRGLPELTAEADAAPAPQEPEPATPEEATQDHPEGDEVATPDQTASPTPPASTPPASTPTAPAKTVMTRNKPQSDKKDDGKYFTENKRLIDKKDSGKYFTANKPKVDKPDDGAFFTENTKADEFNPCLKADGTPYTGPGTALNPFAPTNPCLPQAIAGDDVVTPPVETASDVIQPLPMPSPPPFLGPYTPLPPGGGTGSDYRAA